ncbi:MAG: single-stranded-DNA-specific exonuclease RecJ, partial [Flavobacteriaceae bacterium]
MQWKKKSAPSQDHISTFAHELGVPQAVAALLIQRGIEDFHSAKEFFRPEWTHLHDPFKMKDMEPAVVRIQNAMAQKEKVMIFGDYDVDGTTAVALVSSYLKDKIVEVLPYIPDRYTEGYGISFKGIDYAHTHGITLIIALDCGIKAIDQVAYAHSLGIDFIICDHHLPGLKLPGAVAVLDPKREDCEYPFKELCGCGIGFKLIQALQHRLGLPEEALHSYLDLVATAIAADIVPMVGENRTLTYFGLKRLREQPRVGLQVFTKELKRSLGVSDLVFVLAPRINAAGRMEQGLSAVELLMSTEMETALPIARSIEFFNSERKSTEGRITEEALQQIELEEQHTNCTTV